MTLLELFKRCYNAEEHYIHVEEDGSYLLQKEGDTLYLLLQKSNGKVDWKNNFDFPARPYKDMPKTWRAHRGFVKVWKAIEPYIAEAIRDPSIKQIITIGYSHGAALAVLAHEYVWYNRPDIFDQCYGFAFEAPRVFCGVRIPKELKQRWENMYVIRVCNDLVTHVPPLIFGYKHVGTLMKLEPKEGHKLIKHKKFDCINAHYPDNIMLVLRDNEHIQNFLKEDK